MDGSVIIVVGEKWVAWEMLRVFDNEGDFFLWTVAQKIAYGLWGWGFE